MRKPKNLLWQTIPLALSACVFCLASCNDKNDQFDDKGSSQVVTLDAPSLVYMGDSVEVSFSVKTNGIKANQSKIQLYVDSQMVSERIMQTPTDGSYSGKIAVPFTKNTDDKRVTIRVRTQNERFAAATAELDVEMQRPKYAELYLIDSEGKRHVMLPSAGNPYLYSVTDYFPSELYATIVAPAYGDRGNEVVFGYSDGTITNGAKGQINFSADVDGRYTVTFNTKTYEGTPFVKFAVNGVEFSKVDNSNYKVDMDLRQGEIIEITGLKADYAKYWINPTFFDVVKGTGGKKLKFRGMDGKYRIVCDKGLLYFRVLPLSASGALASLANDEPGIYVIGSNGIGMPSYASNKSNWSPKESNAMAFCQVRENVYEVIMEAGRVVNPSSINFKFYYNWTWGTEFVAGNYANSDDMQPYFRVNASDGNIRQGSAGITAGKFYVITMDLTDGPKKVVASCKELDAIAEVEP